MRGSYLNYWGEGRCPRCEGYGCWHHTWDRIARWLLATIGVTE